ncbi:MAG: sensor domain-containing diguanylate cyclase [Desulfobulbaceae bacterium]|nr:sensor domain-containing diguanylate cyclase [Desulfobulbaceae bacterium]
MKKSTPHQDPEAPQPPPAGKFMRDWLGSLAALIGAALITGGLIPPHAAEAPPVLAVAALLGISGLQHLRRRWTAQPLPPQEGALLLVILTWLIFLVGGWHNPALVLLPALALAHIAYRQSWQVLAIVVLTLVAMAAGPLLLGRPAPSLATLRAVPLLLAVGLVLRLLPATRRSRQEAATEAPAVRGGKSRGRLDLVRDLGITAKAASLPETIHSLDAKTDGATFSRQTLSRLNTSFELQLEMIRQSLGLTTVAVLWPSPNGSELRLRWLATTREDINRGPYPAGRGITGAVSDEHPEIDLVPVNAAHPDIPYYENQQGIGAVLILRLPTEAESGPSEDHRHGLLCVDRAAGEPWSDQERAILRLAARKLGLEVETSRLLLSLDRDRTAIHQLSLALRELNSGVTVAAVLAATVKAVKSQVPVDLVAVSLREGEDHRLVIAEGKNVLDLIDKRFSLAHGLVGQAIRVGAVLPAGGRYPKPAPIFSPDRTFSEFGSLLIFPLRTEENEPLGALVAAGAAPGLFTKGRQDILELITTQVAIKIELAQAHERLGRLATTDGLTGLANHRAFQHGLEVMLQRARRNRTPLCLLMGDLDLFKQINDQHGHPFGDLVLRQVAQIMTETLRTIDLAARYGGEEFALVLENCDATGGLQLAERIRERIGALALECDSEEPVRPTISLGLAVFPEDGSSKDLLIERSDRALYRAKRRGRNRTVIWLASDED